MIIEGGAKSTLISVYVHPSSPFLYLAPAVQILIDGILWSKTSETIFVCQSHWGQNNHEIEIASDLKMINEIYILEGGLQFSKVKVKKVIFLDARKYWENFLGREIKTTMLA